MLHATCCDMLRVENRTSAHTRAQHCCTSLAKRLQLFRERLSYKRGRAHATMSKVIKGNGGSYNCLIETQGVSAWWKETAQTRVFVLSPSLLLNHLKPQSCKALRLLPIITMGIVAHPLTLLWENLCRNSCIKSCNIRKCCMKNLTNFKFELTAPSISQHVATGWPNARNMLHPPTMLR